MLLKNVSEGVKVKMPGGGVFTVTGPVEIGEDDKYKVRGMAISLDAEENAIEYETVWHFTSESICEVY